MRFVHFLFLCMCLTKWIDDAACHFQKWAIKLLEIQFVRRLQSAWQARLLTGNPDTLNKEED